MCKQEAGGRRERGAAAGSGGGKWSPQRQAGSCNPDAIASAPSADPGVLLVAARPQEASPLKKSSPSSLLIRMRGRVILCNLLAIDGTQRELAGATNKCALRGSTRSTSPASLFPASWRSPSLPHSALSLAGLQSGTPSLHSRGPTPRSPSSPPSRSRAQTRLGVPCRHPQWRRRPAKGCRSAPWPPTARGRWWSRPTCLQTLLMPGCRTCWRG